MKIVLLAVMAASMATTATSAEPFKTTISNVTATGSAASAMFEIVNVSGSDAKMVIAECVFRAEDGTALDNDQTAILLIEAGASAVEKFNVYNAPAADSVDCFISSYRRVN